MNILFLSRWFPYPPDNGSRIRIFNLLKSLSQRHNVSLLSFVDQPPSPVQLEALQLHCDAVETVSYRPFQPGRARALLGYLSPRPRSVLDTFSPELQHKLRHLLDSRPFDVVIASQIDMALYAAPLTGVRKIFEEIELTTLHEKFTHETHPLKKWRSRLTWWKLTRYVNELLPRFDACTVVSAPEKARLQTIVPGYNSITVVPNGVDTRQHVPGLAHPQPDTLIYSGALTYSANFDAVDYFLRQIFPLILAERPSVRLFVTGKLNGVPLDRLPKNENVTFTGYIDDIGPKIAASWVNVVPLRLGGGTRLKVLESLALGTPVVATPKGAEGLDLAPGRDWLPGQTPAEFAAAVLRLLSDPELRNSLSRAGRQAVEQKYGWDSIGGQFADFVEQIAANPVKEAVSWNV